METTTKKTIAETMKGSIQFSNIETIEIEGLHVTGYVRKNMYMPLKKAYWHDFQTTSDLCEWLQNKMNPTY